MNRDSSIIRNIDKFLLLLFIFITLCGLVNVYAAVYTYDMDGTHVLLSRFWKQIAWISLSLIVGLVFLHIHSYFYESMAYILYALVIILLLLTPLFAHNIKGSLSWINIGPISFQPAEFSKWITALAVSSYLGKLTNDSDRTNKFIVPSLLVMIPMLILILLQHETGSAIVFISFAFVFCRCGLSPYILITGLLIVLCFLLSIVFSSLVACLVISLILAIWLWIKRKMKSNVRYIYVLIVYVGLIFFSNFSSYAFYHVLSIHQQRRIEVLLGMRVDDKGVGYNANQAKIAIGSGGLTGKGFLQGTQNKLNYLPEQDTDFIFCTVGEEWGFVGTSTVLLLYFLFLIHLIKIAERQNKMFSMIFIYCFTFIFMFHVVINIGMVLDLLPVIGIPLPFFSYGGSSFLSFSIMLFITLRLDIERKD